MIFGDRPSDYETPDPVKKVLEEAKKELTIKRQEVTTTTTVEEFQLTTEDLLTAVWNYLRSKGCTGNSISPHDYQYDFSGTDSDGDGGVKVRRETRTVIKKP